MFNTTFCRVDHKIKLGRSQMKLRSASARARVWRRPEFRRCQTLDFDDFFARRRRDFFKPRYDPLFGTVISSLEGGSNVFTIFLAPSARFPVPIMVVISVFLHSSTRFRLPNVLFTNVNRIRKFLAFLQKHNGKSSIELNNTKIFAPAALQTALVL